MTEHASDQTPRGHRFWDRIADRYAASPVADEASYRRKLAAIRARLAPDASVLEVGCGTGSTALALAGDAGSYLATDASARMIALARAKPGAGAVAFRRMTLEDLADAPARFDAVLAMSLLHLLDDPAQGIATIRRLLRPGGLFFSSTACLGDRMWWMRPGLAAGAWLGALPRVRFLTQARLTGLLREAGFEALEQWRAPRGPAVFVAARLPGDAA